MQTAVPLQLDFTPPATLAAETIATMLGRAEPVDRVTLLRTMEEAYGASSANGAWSIREAFDVLELAQVIHLAGADLPSDPHACLSALVEATAALPTHTVRSEEQIELQQMA